MAMNQKRPVRSVYTEHQKESICLPLLAGKVKCASCGCHYVDESVEITDRSIRRDHRRRIPGVGLAYVDKKRTTTVLAEYAKRLAILGFHEYNPDSLRLDLRCICGHVGIYILKPNPFYDHYENYALEA